MCKLQSSYICGEIKNQIKNNEAYNGTKIGNYFRNGSSEACFNELMRVLLDSFSKQERALILEEHKGEQGNGFRPRRWRGHGCSFSLPKHEKSANKLFALFCFTATIGLKM